MKQIISISIALGCALHLNGAVPLVSSITVEPLGQRKATINYTTSEAGIATFQISTNGVPLPHATHVRTIQGAINQFVTNGNHSFTWDMGRDYNGILSDLSVAVSLHATNNPPLFCAVYLVPVADTSPAFWYASESEVPFGTGDARYKKDWLLLRKVPATSGRHATIGSAVAWEARNDNGAPEDQRPLIITAPFYMGIYPVTQRQWVTVMNVINPSAYSYEPDWECRPVESITYLSIRENSKATSTDAEHSWPTSREPHPATFVGKLRAICGQQLKFDLPTDAQWEYACRAGTAGPWNNTADGDLSGRTQNNGGYAWDESQNKLVAPATVFGSAGAVPAAHGTAIVGSYQPNAWGLYDMHGNVYEWCLDWYTADVTSLSVIDPCGPDSGDNGERVYRGGSCVSSLSRTRSASRNFQAPDKKATDIGFRLAAQAILFHD